MKKHEKCPICSSKNIKTKYQHIVSPPPESIFSIVQCEECSAQFVSEILTSEVLNFYYNNECTKTDYIYSDENKNNLNYYYRKLRKKIEVYVKQGRILDVGCSSGQFLEVMSDKDKNWECYGIELSAHYANIAKEKYGDNIKTSSLEEYDAPDGFFDVITLQDSLDHMPNPNEIISKCYKLLKPRGIIVIKAHNINCLWAKIAKEKFYAIIPPYHLFYYNKKSITTLLKNNGFICKWFGTIPHLLKIKTIFYRLSRGNSKTIWYKIFEFVGRYPIGNINIRKNLHDIFTLVAIK